MAVSVRNTRPSFLLSASIVAALMAAIAACVGDDASNVGAVQPEGGPGVDGSSGGVDSPSGDAPLPDSAVSDTGTDTAPGFSPANIPGLAVWLDGQDTSTFMLGTGGVVSQWRDKSSASNHAVGVAGASPTRTDNAKGKKVLRFTGTQALFVADNASLYFQDDDDFTIAFVASFTEGGRGFLAKVPAPPTPENGILFFTYGSNTMCFALENGSCSPFMATLNDYHRYIMRRTADGTQMRVTYDGVLTVVRDIPLMDVSNGGRDLLIGASRLVGTTTESGLKGDIAEVIIYHSTAASDPDGGTTNSALNELDGYLKTKWGL